MNRNTIPAAQELQILILEDSAEFASLVETVLQHAGFTFNSLIIDTPGELTAALDQQPWDLVVSDYRMPDFTGIDALHLLRERDTQTPFILMTSIPSPSLARLVEEGGGQVFLDKCDLFDIPDHITRFLDRTIEPTGSSLGQLQ